MCFRFTSSPELFQSFMDLVLRGARRIIATVYTDYVVAFFMASAYYLKHFSEFFTECASRGLPLSQESTDSLPTSGVVRVRCGLWKFFRSSIIWFLITNLFLNMPSCNIYAARCLANDGTGEHTNSMSILLRNDISEFACL